MNIENFISLLAKNNEAEQGAIDGYFKLLGVIKENGLPMELYNQIKEIISDELNHSIVLSDWIVRLSGIRPKKD